MSHVKKLADIADILFGQTFRGKAEASDASSGIRLLQIRDIKEGYITDIAALSFADIERERLSFQLQHNDLLVPVRGNRFESAILSARLDDSIVTTTNQVAVIRPLRHDVSVDYLLWYLNSARGRTALNAVTKGNTVPSISRQGLSSIAIPLPSAEVQNNIVKIYRNWQKQKHVLNELLTNGQELSDQHCYRLSMASETTYDE